MERASTKRPGSPSLEASSWNPLKRIKRSVLEAATSTASSLLSGTVRPPIASSQPPRNYDGLLIYNFSLVSIDETGHIMAIPPASEKIVKGLLTPDPTPDAVSDKPNPFDTIPELGHASPANFAYTGDIMLFGLVPAQFFAYQHISTHGFPYHEAAKIKAQRLSLGSLLPELKGSPLDAIALQDPQFGFAERTFDLARPAGLYFETDIVFQGPLQPVADFLKDFFHQGSPAIHFSAYLGQVRDWNHLFAPSSFALRGSLEHVSVKILDVLEFTCIGVELSGTLRLSHNSGDSKWEFGYGFFGSLNLSVPGSVVPLKVDYLLRKEYSSWLLWLTLTDENWENCFGVKGLNVRTFYI
jgi:hypothetical protein